MVEIVVIRYEYNICLRMRIENAFLCRHTKMQQYLPIAVYHSYRIYVYLSFLFNFLSFFSILQFFSAIFSFLLTISLFSPLKYIPHHRVHREQNKARALFKLHARYTIDRIKITVIDRASDAVISGSR